MNIKQHDFFYITIRGRVAFSICCIENAVEKFDKESLDWRDVFDFLWRYPTAKEIKDLALWHENESEFIPFCILQDIPHSHGNFEYLSEEQFNRFRNIYIKTEHLICDLIDKTSQVAIQSLYGGIRDGSPITLNYLDEIIQLMKSANIKLPRINFFKQFSYPEIPENDWLVWGNCISRDLLAQESKWIDRI